MSEHRFNSLCLISIEHENADTLLKDLSPVVDRFALLKDRKLALVL